MEKSCRCDICNVQRASYAKHLRSRKRLKNEKQNEMIPPEWLFQEPIANKKNPKILKEITTNNFKLGDKQVNKELAKNKNNPCYFTDRALPVGFNISLDSYHINHSISELTNKPNFPEFGVELRYIDKLLKEMATIFAR